MNKILPAGAVALALIAGGAWYMTQGAAPGTTALPGAANAQASDVDTSSVIEMIEGNADASVQVIEYASYTCPHCASFHENTYKQLKADYIDTGKIGFTFREVYFDKFGMWASMIARCDGPEKFFGVTDLMMKGQSTWARAGSEGAIADELRKVGRLAGMDSEQIDACLTDGDKLQTLVAWYQQNVTEHDISSTPSFIINGEKYSNMSYADFKVILDEKLAE
ncbi:MAG: DsbA family protein [Pelagimonas sp.]|uniref:DsbA family protein n=1 Tax=Pelagimonas sp. TaxID=2073170 RepID=UPI003D6AB7B6